MIVNAEIVSSFGGKSISLTQSKFRDDEQSSDNTDSILSNSLDFGSEIVNSRENFSLTINFVFYDYFNFQHLLVKLQCFCDLYVFIIFRKRVKFME